MNDEPTMPLDQTEPGPNPNTGIGGNNPPVPILDDDLLQANAARAARFVEVSDKWQKVAIETEEQASALGDQIGGLRQLFKKIDADRSEEWKTHKARADKVQEAYRPVLRKLELSINALVQKADAYLQKKQAEVEAKKRAEEAAAKEAQEKARLAALQAEQTSSIEDAAAAEAAKKEAEVAARTAAKPASAKITSQSGAARTISTRKHREVKLLNARVAALHYQHAPELLDVLERLAKREANSAGFKDDQKIPGFDVDTKHRAV